MKDNFGKIIVIGAIAIIILSIVLTNVFKAPNPIVNVTGTEALALMQKKDPQIIYIGRTGCSYCDMIAPILKTVGNELELTINYVDLSTCTEEEVQKLEKSNSYMSENEWGTPTVLIMSEGNLIDYLGGYDEEDAVREFFVKNGFGENNEKKD